MAKKKREVGAAAPAVAELSITRSYSRKLNMSAYGGKQYETADLSATRTAHNVPVDSSKQVSEDLYQQCVEEVEASIDAIANEIDEIKSEDVKPKKQKKKVAPGVDIEATEMEEITTYVNDLTLAKTKGKLKEAVVKIRTDAARFSDSQKEYLTAYYKKRLAALDE